MNPLVLLTLFSSPSAFVPACIPEVALAWNGQYEGTVKHSIENLLTSRPEEKARQLELRDEGYSCKDQGSSWVTCEKTTEKAVLPPSLDAQLHLRFDGLKVLLGPCRGASMSLSSWDRNEWSIAQTVTIGGVTQDSWTYVDYLDPASRDHLLLNDNELESVGEFAVFRAQSALSTEYGMDSYVSELRFVMAP